MEAAEIELSTLRGSTVRACFRQNAGAARSCVRGLAVAHGDVYWFLHADTRPPPDAITQMARALRSRSCVGGNFRLRFSGDTLPARFMTWFYHHIGRFDLCYGDSAIFARREVYRACGGFRGSPLFEDLDLVARLKQLGRFVPLPGEVITSSRRFEERNFFLTFLIWICLQLLYWLGVPPGWLARLYAPIRTSAADESQPEIR